VIVTKSIQILHFCNILNLYVYLFKAKHFHMKKLLPLLIITFVSSTAHAQYFKNVTYLNSYSSLDPFFSYDSIQSIYQSDSLEL
jgi:hypothetical protein